ncbi:MAG: CDP-diacylglycerol--serine O-phosphatidyltransferase [Bacteroidetes bacterium]|nr:CDP-diacylglycerol--serine O-phosphatidyltransferase [Bacteroidota bacterium]
MRITRAVVPSLFTTLNTFCGFLSIVSAHEGHIQNAALFIILAGVFDSLDGLMARITRSSSQFGVELDSLADVVSFGAAPSFMIYKAYLYQYENLGILLASLPLLFGSIRLARFNVQLVGFDKDYFNGLPIPAQAITLCAFVLQYYSEYSGFSPIAQVVIIPMVILLSLLMVSTVKYDTLPKFTKKDFRAHPWKLVSMSMAALIILFSKGALIFAVIASYVLFGVLRWAIRSVRALIGVQEHRKDEVSQVTSIDI